MKLRMKGVRKEHREAEVDRDSLKLKYRPQVRVVVATPVFALVLAIPPGNWKIPMLYGPQIKIFHKFNLPQYNLRHKLYPRLLGLHPDSSKVTKL